MADLLRRILEFLLSWFNAKKLAADASLAENNIEHNDQKKQDLEQQTSNGDVDRLNKQFDWNENN